MAALYLGPVWFLPRADAAAIRFKRRASLGLTLPDEALGHALKAAHDVRLDWRGLSYSSRQVPFPGQELLGYRASGLDRPDAPAADAVVLGDSFTAGLEVDARKAWPSRLEAATGLRVANLGVPSYGTTQEVRLYAEYGRRLRPKLVVLLLVTNDPRDNHLFASWLRDRSSASLPTGERDFQRYKFCAGLGLPPGKRCRALEFAMTRFGAAPSVVITQLATLWINWVHGSDGFEEGLRLLEADLRSLKRLADDGGAGLAVVLHPNWKDRRWSRWYPEALPRLSAALRSEGVPFLELGETALRPGGGVRLTVALDGHWNEAGHARVAEEVGRFLAERGLLRRAAARPASEAGK